MSIEEHHDQPGYADSRIVVREQSRSEIICWPWRFINTSGDKLETAVPLSEFCLEPIGAQFITGKDEVYLVTDDYARRIKLPADNVRVYGTGEDVRDWQCRPKQQIVFPYKADLSPMDEPLPTTLQLHLGPHKDTLENCVISGSIRKKETRLKWFEFRRLARAKFAVEYNIMVPQIATHPHFVISSHGIAFKEKAQAIVLKRELGDEFVFAVTAILNSSLVADYLKRESFSKRESDDPEKDTYFEFSGKKLESVPIPADLEHEQRVQTDLALFARQAQSLGLSMAANSAKLIFAELNPYLSTGQLSAKLCSEDEFRSRWHLVKTTRESALKHLIAVQEAIDWLVYGVYGQLDRDDPALGSNIPPDPIEPDERPFRYWELAGGNHEKAVSSIGTTWSADQRKRWEARLVAIRDNKQIQRLEQAMYKRRWDEQWKVGNEWRCGEIAYAAEFIDAFEWWLKEKAEWWVENKKGGGPAELDEWIAALWSDEQVQAAWPVVAENYGLLGFDKARAKTEQQGDPVPERPKPKADRATFARQFKTIIEEETVPEGFEFGTEYGALEKKLGKKIPPKLAKVRGKLNVPRERFHSVGKTQYKWASLQFREANAKSHSSAKKTGNL